MVRRIRFRRSVAQWLEHRSPKPGVAGSSPATPASKRLIFLQFDFGLKGQQQALATGLLPFRTGNVPGSFLSLFSGLRSRLIRGVHLRYGVLLHSGQDVRIEVERYPDLGMAKPFAGNLRMTTDPALVVLDTLNRSLRGSENDSKDMAAYIAAADAIREAFDCAVVIVHHCGIDGTRPRGSTALSGAVDAQLSVKRDASDAIIVEVEFLKDGPPGEIIASKLQVVEVGKDVDDEIISSCVVVPADAPKIVETGPKLTKNEQTMYSILRDAGQGGLTTDEWK
jgi:AAA domain